MRNHPLALLAAVALAIPTVVVAQQQAPQPAAPQPTQPTPQQLQQQATRADHQQMMQQLGITALRPGPSGNNNDPNAANTDESKANPYPDWPDLMTFKNGRRVTNARQWTQRRAEIVEDFEREVVGRIPANVPRVTWTVTATDSGVVGGRKVIGRQLVGRVDNSSYPDITVEIQATMVLPADAGGALGKVPMMVLFGFPTPVAQAVGKPAPPPPAGQQGGFRFPPPAPGTDVSGTEQLIVDGWGYVSMSPGSVQADNGAGLRRGIIGLVNKGEPRKPDDWGSLRAWQWGASRVLDYLATLPEVDATKVGVEGVSRYGKAALVTMAFDQRFAAGFIGSSGEGGASAYRRNFGEMVENLTGSGEYHWMAGNFLKYGAGQASFGSKNASDLPVDAHMLIALAAPRLTFISYGIPARGDALWLDQQGSWMATVAAQPAWRIQGARDLGVSTDYRTSVMPGVTVAVLNGHLGWRQHDGGHTTGPNWKHFIAWADWHWNRRYTPANAVGILPDSSNLPGRAQAAPQAAPPAAPQAQAPQAQAPRQAPTRRPPWIGVPRPDSNSAIAHRQLLAKRTQGKIDAFFLGNSITRRWGATDYPDFLAHWNQSFRGWNAGNFGWGADLVEHMIWRIENGELDGVNPKVVVISAGTNNVGGMPGDSAKVADITRGIRTLLELVQRKAPNATVVLMGIFPRNGQGANALAVIPEIRAINRNIAAMADGRRVRYLDIGSQLADADGRLLEGMTVDNLHLSLKGYEVWANALKPVFREVMGPPAATDQAPPPTGDPSAANRRP